MSVAIEQKSLIRLVREMLKQVDALALTGKDLQFELADSAAAKTLQRLADLRGEVLSSTPETLLDRLMMFGAIRAIAQYLLAGVNALPEKDQDPLLQILSGLFEICTGLNQLQNHFEEDNGTTLAGLGLFTDQGCLQ